MSVWFSNSVIGIAEAFDCGIFCQERKRKVLKCQMNADLEKRLTSDPFSTNLHVVNMQTLHPVVCDVHDDGNERIQIG
jgi:hypothetical protein